MAFVLVGHQVDGIFLLEFHDIHSVMPMDFPVLGESHAEFQQLLGNVYLIVWIASFGIKLMETIFSFLVNWWWYASTEYFRELFLIYLWLDPSLNLVNLQQFKLAQFFCPLEARKELQKLWDRWAKWRLLHISLVNTGFTVYESPNKIDQVLVDAVVRSCVLPWALQLIIEHHHEFVHGLVVFKEAFECEGVDDADVLAEVVLQFLVLVQLEGDCLIQVSLEKLQALSLGLVDKADEGYQLWESEFIDIVIIVFELFQRLLHEDRALLWALWEVSYQLQ